MTEKECMELLYKAVLTLETPEECHQLFEDLCTPKELKSMAQRFAVAKMLSEVRTYKDIVIETAASTATISRVSRTMSNGTKIVLERLK